jgi:hypothetical protein
MKYINWISCLILVIVLESCVNFKSGWGEFNTKSDSGNIENLLQEAYKIESKAASAESVLSLIDTFKKVEQADSNNYLALWKIGNYNILMGAAYSQKVKEKKAYYR